MKTFRTSLIVLLLALCTAGAAPVTFEEVSLLVRMGEREASIRETVSERKLLHPLNPAQETALKRAGAADSLLAALRQPAALASEAEIAAFEKQKKQQEESAQRAMAAVPKAAEAKRSLQPPATGRTLVIDRIIFKKLPLPRPFYLYMHAQAGRSDATFYVPRQRYGARLTDTGDIEVPVKIVLRNVEPNSWATVDVHLDNDADAVKTYQALKRHTARIQILDYPQQTGFTPDLQVTPFSYDLKWHAE
jgi:hypothetical protein